MISEFYENETFEMYKSFHLGIRKELPYYQKIFFKKNHLDKGKLLDIGCGDGLFLEYAEKVGYEVYGIDLDKKSIEVAKTRLKNGKVFAMSLNKFIKKAKHENLKFDVITFFEVLEHQDNPNKFLQDVKSLLKPGGIVAGSVPNRNSFFQKKVYREIYNYIDYPPHHFLRFSVKSLENALKINFFDNIFISIPTLSFRDLIYLIQEIFLSKSPVFRKIKNTLKNTKQDFSNLLIDTTDTKNYNLKIKFIKILRDITLFPFITPFLLKKEGLHLYFQAKI
jgi:ubiquinone biosynthesis O-methyltransferase